MEFEFDKEIDALLHQTAKGESAFAAENPQSAIRNPQLEHLDADEISAFAENALPNKARIRVTKHLADCDPCRVSLSNLVVLNSEAETEMTVSPVAETKEVKTAEVSIPWYKKLFAYKNLAYGLGALVILFAGFTAFIVLQNFNNAATDVASVSNKATDRSEFPSQSENEFSNSANTAANIAADENLMANEASDFENDIAETGEAKEDQKQVFPNNQETLSDSKMENESRNRDEIGMLKSEPKPAATPAADGYAEKPQPTAKNQIASGSDKNVTSSEENADITASKLPEDTRQNSPITTRNSGRVKEKKSESRKDAGERETDDAPSPNSKRRISGKTFTQTNGIWIDSDYRNQKTTNLRRGTSDYRKLDSDLRSITDKLNGTVVIVWKTRAYKIQ